MTDRSWEPGGWSQCPAVQQPQYPEPAAREAALATLRACPPLVAVGEVNNLKARLARAGRGEAFILQGGNCAERFIDCRADSIANKLKILLQMSVILAYGVRKPVVRIGRFAGQYAKPRSNDTEVVDGRELPVYRGDAVNSVEPTPEARAADPQRLVSSYFYAAATLNHIRALIDGGFADLRHPYTWNLSSMEHSRNWDEYRTVLDRILDAINFMESFGGARSDVLGRVDFFTSHEGLLLGYEEALTRKDPDSGRWYNLGAHMLWIGMRTRQVDGAHVEYFRGIANPIGLKVDAGMRPEEVLALSDVLNPANEEGHLTLITRLGAARVEERLPQLIQAVRDAGRKVVWSCDPMHGNTVTLDGGRKTRDFCVVLDELRTTFDVHRRQDTHLAGVHFELTAADVTECIGGAGELTSGDLSRRYETYCDPRLNCSQSLEMAFLIARLLQSQQS